MTTRDVEVSERDSGEWLAVEEDGTVHTFPCEDEACAFQRGYRAAQGLDLMTGEPL